MASFGAQYPHFAKIKEEPEGKLPVYEGPPVRIGRLVKADLTVTMASGQLFADDVLAESVEEFVSGSLAMETDDMEDSVAEAVYGATVVDKEVHYKSGDSAPVGGLAYYKVLKRKGILLYKGYFYPRVQAALGNDTASSKTGSITLGTTNTTFTVFPCESTDWRITADFKTLEEAKEWVKTKLTSTPSGTEEPSGGEQAAG